MVENNSNLPIDIHCSKLLEWLQSRRHCSKDWQRQVLAVRTRIAQAIQDMPEHPEILNMLAGAYINYFHCLRIREILKTTESGSKNIFGTYSSQRIKDWQDILGLYEKDNLYLSESAQILQQYTQYEIPALKKQQARCQTAEEDCERKIVDYDKQCKEFDKKYKEECQKMGVHGGDNLKQQLLHLADDLPQRLDQLATGVGKLKPLVEYYEKFSKFSTGQKSSSTTEKQLLLVSDLRFLIEKGNVTVFEWKRGWAPEKVERVTIGADKNQDQEDETQDTIDFGDDIDFGGIEEVASGQEVVVTDPKGVVVEAAKEDIVDKVARLDEALSLLEHDGFLKALNRDLKELEAFLNIRQLELKRQPTSADSFTVLDADLDLDVEQLAQHLYQLNSLTGQLNDENLKRTRLLRCSPPYVEKLVDILCQPLKNKRRLEHLKVVARERIDECRRTLVETKKQTDLLTERSKELQQRLEQDISKRYQNRPVHIIGSTVVVKT